MQTAPASMEINGEISQKAKFRTLSYNLSKPLLGLYPEAPKPYNRATRTSTLIDVLVTMWKEDVCQLMKSYGKEVNTDETLCNARENEVCRKMIRIGGKKGEVTQV